MAKKVSNRGIPLFTKPQPESTVEDIWHFPEARIAEESDEEATFTDPPKENSIMVRNDQKIQPSKKQGSKKRTRSPSSAVAIGQESKKTRLTDSKESYYIEGFVAITESIEKLVIETRENRLALIEVMRELLCELRKACLGYKILEGMYFWSSFAWERTGQGQEAVEPMNVNMGMTLNKTEICAARTKLSIKRRACLRIVRNLEEQCENAIHINGINEPLMSSTKISWLVIGFGTPTRSIEQL
ncbi:hypothetical protein HYPSUDRAFT_54181 [Hypholoma sublateritium FD-334 SS-4]|uniref:Uncharacterized protein n=1 Tax=Hypholoma sublateritium (strain FD-334 SS-4) TaxID=945553 RepID=A0A0D2NYF4_HYPSF|nr:hypothetical protein HYPSUDRAFT_54181 [Hypholoma sublateritium FD-334 SS-4]